MAVQPLINLQMVTNRSKLMQVYTFFLYFLSLFSGNVDTFFCKIQWQHCVLHISDGRMLLCQAGHEEMMMMT